jgi:hypothetical protein
VIGILKRHIAIDQRNAYEDGDYPDRGPWPQESDRERNRSDNCIANLRERRHRVALLRPASQTVAERDAYFCLACG